MKKHMFLWFDCGSVLWCEHGAEMLGLWAKHLKNAHGGRYCAATLRTEGRRNG